MNPIYGFRAKILLYFQLCDTPVIDYDTNSQKVVFTFINRHMTETYVYKIKGSAALNQ